ncbi:MAG: hypothetical protein L7U87_05015 [Chlamydiales bacterium]|nr:hypothetical protein [Chlamydiales bacterium]
MSGFISIQRVVSDANYRINGAIRGSKTQKALLFPYTNHPHRQLIMGKVSSLVDKTLELLSSCLDTEDDYSYGFARFRILLRNVSEDSVLNNDPSFFSPSTLSLTLHSLIRINAYIANDLVVYLLKNYSELRPLCISCEKPSLSIQKHENKSLTEEAESSRQAIIAAKECATLPKSERRSKYSKRLQDCAKASLSSRDDEKRSIALSCSINRHFNYPFGLPLNCNSGIVAARDKVMDLFRQLRTARVIDKTPTNCTRTFRSFSEAFISISSGDSNYHLTFYIGKLMGSQEKLYTASGDLNPNVIWIAEEPESNIARLRQENFIDKDPSKPKPKVIKEQVLPLSNSDCFLIILPSAQRFIIRPFIGGRWGQSSHSSRVEEDIASSLFYAYSRNDSSSFDHTFASCQLNLSARSRLIDTFQELNSLKEEQTELVEEKNKESFQVVKAALSEETIVNLRKGSTFFSSYLCGIPSESYVIRRYAQNVLAHLLFTNLLIKPPDALLYNIPVLSGLYPGCPPSSLTRAVFEEEIASFKAEQNPLVLPLKRDRLKELAYRQFVIIAILSAAIFQDHRRLDFSKEIFLPSSNSFPMFFEYDSEILKEAPLYKFILANGDQKGLLTHQELYEIGTLSVTLLCCSLSSLGLEKEAVSLFADRLMHMQNYILVELLAHREVNLKKLYEACITAKS